MDDFDVVELVAEQPGERLDKALAALLEGYSRAQIQQLIRDGQVTVKGQPAKASYRLEPGDTIRVQVPAEDNDAGAQAQAISLTVLYEDDDVAVVDKPAGMVVHPAFGHDEGTLVNAVLHRWPQTAQFGQTDRAGIVHRLDKETSGVILIAKTDAALESLRGQFQARTVHKRYLALVEGAPPTPEGVIDAPIGRDPRQRKRMAVTHDGRAAVTEYRLLEEFADYSLLEVFPRTGRTHQIRVHLAFVGNPVVGDTVYGRRKQGIKMKRHFLHAALITFDQPRTGQLITVEAALPGPLRDVLDKLPR